MRSACAIFVLLASTLACESPEARRERVIDEAATCAPGDTCVVAGNSDCACGQPVNEAHVAEVRAATEAVACCDLFGGCVAVDCAAFVNVRCENGRCVGD